MSILLSDNTARGVDSGIDDTSEGEAAEVEAFEPTNKEAKVASAIGKNTEATKFNGKEAKTSESKEVG